MATLAWTPIMKLMKICLTPRESELAHAVSSGLVSFPSILVFAEVSSTFLSLAASYLSSVYWRHMN